MTRKGKRATRTLYFITTLRTAPEALLRRIRQRWSLESELRTVAMNLLRRAGYRSICQGCRELAYDIQGMLALGDVAVPTGGNRGNF